LILANVLLRSPITPNFIYSPYICAKMRFISNKKKFFHEKKQKTCHSQLMQTNCINPEKLRCTAHSDSRNDAWPIAPASPLRAGKSVRDLAK